MTWWRAGQHRGQDPARSASCRPAPTGAAAAAAGVPLRRTGDLHGLTADHAPARPGRLIGPSISNATRLPRTAASSLVPPSVRNTTMWRSRTKFAGITIGPRSSTKTTRPTRSRASNPKHSDLDNSCQQTRDAGNSLMTDTDISAAGEHDAVKGDPASSSCTPLSRTTGPPPATEAGSRFHPVRATAPVAVPRPGAATSDTPGGFVFDVVSTPMALDAAPLNAPSPLPGMTPD